MLRSYVLGILLIETLSSSAIVVSKNKYKYILDDGVFFPLRKCVCFKELTTERVKKNWPTVTEDRYQEFHLY